MWHNQIYQTFGRWVQKQSVHVVVGGLFLFFDAAMLFLDPLPDDLRPGELLCFAAFVQLFQRFLVQPDPEHEVLGIVRYRTASACGHCVTTFLVATVIIYCCDIKVKCFLRKISAAVPEGSGGCCQAFFFRLFRCETEH